MLPCVSPRLADLLVRPTLVATGALASRAPGSSAHSTVAAARRGHGNARPAAAETESSRPPLRRMHRLPPDAEPNRAGCLAPQAAHEAAAEAEPGWLPAGFRQTNSAGCVRNGPMQLAAVCVPAEPCRMPHAAHDPGSSPGRVEGAVKLMVKLKLRRPRGREPPPRAKCSSPALQAPAQNALPPVARPRGPPTAKSACMAIVRFSPTLAGNDMMRDSEKDTAVQRLQRRLKLTNTGADARRVAITRASAANPRGLHVPKGFEHHHPPSTMELHEPTRLAAARIVQRSFRARRVAHVEKNAATRIESRYRGHATMLKHEQRRKAATCVQRSFRAHHAVLPEQSRAATLIEARYRGRQSRSTRCNLVGGGCHELRFIVSNVCLHDVCVLRGHALPNPFVRLSFEGPCGVLLRTTRTQTVNNAVTDAMTTWSGACFEASTSVGNPILVLELFDAPWGVNASEEMLARRRVRLEMGMENEKSGRHEGSVSHLPLWPTANGRLDAVAAGLGAECPPGSVSFEFSSFRRAVATEASGASGGGATSSEAGARMRQEQQRQQQEQRWDQQRQQQWEAAEAAAASRITSPHHLGFRQRSSHDVRLTRRIAKDQAVKLLVVLGAETTLKERLCGRLAVRSHGCVLRSEALVARLRHASTSETPAAVEAYDGTTYPKSGGGDAQSAWATFEREFLASLSPSEHDQLLLTPQVASSPRASPPPALVARLLRAAMDHFGAPPYLLADFAQTRLELKALEADAEQARVLVAFQVCQVEEDVELPGPEAARENGEPVDESSSWLWVDETHSTSANDASADVPAPRPESTRLASNDDVKTSAASAHTPSQMVIPRPSVFVVGASRARSARRGRSSRADFDRDGRLVELPAVQACQSLEEQLDSLDKALCKALVQRGLQIDLRLPSPMQAVRRLQRWCRLMRRARSALQASMTREAAAVSIQRAASARLERRHASARASQAAALTPASPPAPASSIASSLKGGSSRSASRPSSPNGLMNRMNRVSFDDDGSQASGQASSGLRSSSPRRRRSSFSPTPMAVPERPAWEHLLSGTAVHYLSQYQKVVLLQQVRCEQRLGLYRQNEVPTSPTHRALYGHRRPPPRPVNKQLERHVQSRLQALSDDLERSRLESRSGAQHRQSVSLVANLHITPKAALTELPAGWVEHFDPKYPTPYFYNFVTRVSSWTRPKTPASAPVSPRRRPPSLAGGVAHRAVPSPPLAIRPSPHRASPRLRA